MRPTTKTATRAAAVFKKEADIHGNDLVIGGQKCKGFSRSIERGDSAFLPQGASNASFPDLCAYMIAPDALEKPVAFGQSVIDCGHTYTVIAVPRPERISSVPIYQTVYVYSPPPPASATTETVAEADASGKPQDAGKRVAYRPKSTNTDSND
ncbi:MAG: hypothetical protein ACRYFS_16360 [Janthinobacterium lividum]